ncbi:MDR family MFS transporter [Corynebacterium mendelii]|uniref:MFS transporter n=1 Tax=Corynebacterium mendelii TaxID=2765362 RepID=A0A939E0P4_9CORY|nr:MDR family MFS transporter [Corynebacterium mendelii]MBN9644799.1 MFS transporter [Corynebacterium mendelii]
MTATHTGTGSPVDHDSSSAHLPLVFTALILSMLMSSLGQMIFSTALPTIVGELHGVNHMTWVITAYLLGQTIALPIFGRIGDQVGRKKLFLGAVATFMAGAAIGGLAQSMGMLIVSRAVQGVAAGGMMVLSQAITADVVPARQRGKYMGIMGAAFAMASVLGPVLGGWFTDGPGWRWGLWLNIPLGVITLLGIMLLLKLPDRATGGTTDVLGMVTMAIATASLILTVTWGGHDFAWNSPVIMGLMGLTAVAGAVFILTETHADNPVIPLSLFANRNFALTTLAGLMIGVFLFGCLAYMPTYLQMVHSLSPTQAGFMLIPMMLTMTVVSIGTGLTVTRTGRYRWYPVAGLLVICGSLFLLSRLSADTTLAKVGAALAVLGVGLGLSFQILVLIVQNSFPITMVGTATAANNFVRQIGASIGTALVGGLFVGNLHNNLADRLPAALTSMGPEGQVWAGKLTGSASGSFTPSLVDSLPAVLNHAVIASYNDALAPIFAILSPVALVTALVLLFVREEKLKDTIE